MFSQSQHYLSVHLSISNFDTKCQLSQVLLLDCSNTSSPPPPHLALLHLDGLEVVLYGRGQVRGDLVVHQNLAEGARGGSA